jgi:hypothetical protein
MRGRGPAGGSSVPPTYVNNMGGVDLASADSDAIQAACLKHGLSARPWVTGGPSPPPARPRVLDVILMTTSSLEMLELRLHELRGSVDRFVIVEGHKEDTGTPVYPPGGLPEFGESHATHSSTPQAHRQHPDAKRIAMGGANGATGDKVLYYRIPSSAYARATASNGHPMRSGALDKFHRSEMQRAARAAGAQPGDIILTGARCPSRTA